MNVFCCLFHSWSLIRYIWVYRLFPSHFLVNFIHFPVYFYSNDISKNWKIVSWPFVFCSLVISQKKITRFSIKKFPINNISVIDEPYVRLCLQWIRYFSLFFSLSLASLIFYINISYVKCWHHNHTIYLRSILMYRNFVIVCCLSVSVYFVSDVEYQQFQVNCFFLLLSLL